MILLLDRQLPEPVRALGLEGVVSLNLGVQVLSQHLPPLAGRPRLVGYELREGGSASHRQECQSVSVQEECKGRLTSCRQLGGSVKRV